MIVRVEWYPNWADAPVGRQYLQEYSERNLVRLCRKIFHSTQADIVAELARRGLTVRIEPEPSSRQLDTSTTVNAGSEHAERAWTDCADASYDIISCLTTWAVFGMAASADVPRWRDRGESARPAAGDPGRADYM